MTNILILGGRSLVAPYLLQRLGAADLGAAVASRQPLTLPEGFTALRLDLEAPNGWQAPEGTIIISLLPIWALAACLPLLDKAKAVIAISSTSRFGKATSDDPKELETVRKLTQAEEKLENWAKEKGIAFTILRPTLIYDGISDVNVTRIAATIRRFGTFPVAAPAKGLRQPIHADDVAGAIMGALNNPRAAGKALNIAGGEILTYREMVERVASSVTPPKSGVQRTGKPSAEIKNRVIPAQAGIQSHKKSSWVPSPLDSRLRGSDTFCNYVLPCPLPLPVWLLKATFRLASATGLLHERHFGFAVFQRMNEDLVFDIKEGLEVLGYAPRPFSLGKDSPTA